VAAPSEPRFIWGVDVGLSRVALTAADLKRRRKKLLATIEIKHERGCDAATKMWNLATELPVWFARQAELAPPFTIWVEVPFGQGKRGRAALLGAYGIVLASLHGAVKGMFDYPVAILPIDPASWKKQAIGKGNAPKEVVHEWARAEGVDHPSGDVLDSYGICVGGMILMGYPAPGKD
jgi:hypothetical protein